MEPACLICKEPLSQCTCSADAKAMRRAYADYYQKQYDTMHTNLVTQISGLELELKLTKEHLENVRGAYHGSAG